MPTLAPFFLAPFLVFLLAFSTIGITVAAVVFLWSVPRSLRRIAAALEHSAYAQVMQPPQSLEYPAAMREAGQGSPMLSGLGH